MNIKSIKNIYSVITYFGKVVYVKDGKTYTINKFTKVEPKKINKDGTYYIEVNKKWEGYGIVNDNILKIKINNKLI